MGIAKITHHQQAAEQHDNGQKGRCDTGKFPGTLDLVQVLLHQYQSNHCTCGAWAGQTKEAEMMLLTVFVGDVQSRQSDSRARKIERADRPNQPSYGKGKFFGTLALEKQKRDERGRKAKTDDVGEAIKLSAKISGMSRESRQPTIEGVEDHG